MAPPPDVATAPTTSDGAARPRGCSWLSLLIAFCALATIGIVTFVGWQIGPLALTVGIVGAILPVPRAGGVLPLAGPVRALARCGSSSSSLPVGRRRRHQRGAAGQPARRRRAGGARATRSSIVAVVVAPVIEELLKAAVPVAAVRVLPRAFTGIIDGIVYCGLSATGFAMVENILYLGGHGFASESAEGLRGRCLRRHRDLHPAGAADRLRPPAVHVDDRDRASASPPGRPGGRCGSSRR